MQIEINANETDICLFCMSSQFWYIVGLCSGHMTFSWTNNIYFVCKYVFYLDFNFHILVLIVINLI